MDELFRLFERPRNPSSIQAMKIAIAGPDKIRSWNPKRGELVGQHPDGTVSASGGGQTMGDAAIEPDVIPGEHRAWGWGRVALIATFVFFVVAYAVTMLAQKG